MAIGDSRGPLDGQKGVGRSGGGSPGKDWLVPFLLIRLRDGGFYGHRLEA